MKATVAALAVAAAAAYAAPPAHEVRIAAGGATLFAREVGRGEPIIVLHGGPDFDHTYMLPEMDRFASDYRLIYYDQRGRGRSAEGVEPEDVSLESDMSDLDKVREHFGLASATILGHSWGGLLALEYAVRHPERVSRLILMNPAPVSAADFARFRQAYVEKLGDDFARLRAVAATDAYKRGDPEAVAAYYRIHFKQALERPSDVEKVVRRIKASATTYGVLKARAVEQRLDNDTWLSNGYDLLPKLSTVRAPTLIIDGDHDFIPAETMAHIASALPNARMVTLEACGHFSYMECPEAVGRELKTFFRRPAGGR